MSAPAPTPEPVATPTDADLAREMAATLIRQFESFRAAPYRDQGGTWTIGYGSIRWGGAPVMADTPPVTIDQAEAAMRGELSATADAVDDMLHVSCSVPQRAALYSLAFNIGTGALRGSTLLRLLNSRDYANAADQFSAWCYAGGKVSNGLVNRRRMERAVFLGLVTP